MIRSETEYKEAVARLKAERARIDEQRSKLQEMDLSEDQIKRVVDPMESFHLQLAEEVESYERLRRGEFGAFINLRAVGQLLIGLRIAQGLSQRDLAERLGTHESQVSRDERNEYHNITLDRASRILEALGVELKITVEDAGMKLAGSS